MGVCLVVWPEVSKVSHAHKHFHVALQEGTSYRYVPVTSYTICRVDIHSTTHEGIANQLILDFQCRLLFCSPNTTIILSSDTQDKCTRQMEVVCGGRVAEKKAAQIPCTHRCVCVGDNSQERTCSKSHTDMLDFLVSKLEYSCMNSCMFTVQTSCILWYFYNLHWLLKLCRKYCICIETVQYYCVWFIFSWRAEMYSTCPTHYTLTSKRPHEEHSIMICYQHAYRM